MSVLENYHSREAFKLIMKTNLLSHLSNDEFKLIRRRFIDTILATDMANHLKHMTNLKNKADLYEIEEGKKVEKLISNDLAKKYENQQAILNLCIHTADVSNPSKPFIVYKKWVDILFVEFFHQGDLEKEKNLPVSLLCDRSTTVISKSQIGFINFVVRPTFDLLARFIPEIKPYRENINLNQCIYESKLEDDVIKIDSLEKNKNFISDKKNSSDELNENKEDKK